ncbi:hypothetical protein AOZ06_04575 [Kibdelosporangium phytohabitans]|uniref:Uncharacterized protein n=1 Tax=Kibdelosporangium phytohabitans TaxID=860235 RepID=A0A0N7F2N1_9PSEU|nr:hypothetical protein AOZ06_04575 [Kibdelosporangium phytohabitans]
MTASTTGSAAIALFTGLTTESTARTTDPRSGSVTGLTTPDTSDNTGDNARVTGASTGRVIGATASVTGVITGSTAVAAPRATGATAAPTTSPRPFVTPPNKPGCALPLSCSAFAFPAVSRANKKNPAVNPTSIPTALTNR